MNTLHRSETNKIAERAARRIKERTPTAMVQLVFELCFFLIKKGQVVASQELEACALIGLHVLAADYEVGTKQ